MIASYTLLTPSENLLRIVLSNQIGIKKEQVSTRSCTSGEHFYEINGLRRQGVEVILIETDYPFSFFEWRGGKIYSCMKWDGETFSLSA